MEAASEWVTGKIQISLYGDPVEMELTVPAKPVKPRRMLPIFQAVTSSFIELGVKELESTGEKISCQAGCGACCRQAVPIAEIEAFQIAELVEQMPEPRRGEIKRRFAEGVKRFHDNKWFERMESYPEMTVKERHALIMEYFHQGVACPFLENESCSIHADRPLSCREYLVTSPAEHCARPTAETIKHIKFKLRPSVTLLEIVPSANAGKTFFVPMIRALEHAEKNNDNTEEKTGEAWMAEFFGSLLKADIPGDIAETENL